MSGFMIETDQIQLRPLHLERDAPLLWEVYKNHKEIFRHFPGGSHSTYEAFYAEQEKFANSQDFFNWTVYVSASAAATAPTPVGNGAKAAKEEEKKWVLCGSICLLDIVLPFRKFEIGSIWFHPHVQGTFVMVETSYALLRFSFEKLQAGRVQWKTHHENIASQKAAKKLGFREEGLFKKHMIDAQGQWRHTYFYAMTDDEWFGRPGEETRDARRGLCVVPEDVSGEVEGRAGGRDSLQRRLEGVIADRKHEGKKLPEGIARGEPLN
jgi:RimJ/RimL family protein N-acetyltransferase